MALPYDNDAFAHAFGVGINTINEEYRAIHGSDIPYDPGMIAVHAQRAAWDYFVGGVPHDTALVKHWDEYRDEYHLPHGGTPLPSPGDLPPFPPVPSRDQRGNIDIGFQGEMVTTMQFGTFPVFGPETSSLDDADLHSYAQQLSGRGYTHAEMAISWQYDERDYHYPVPGRDLSNDLDELARRIRILIHYFSGGVLLHLAGDGLSNPNGGYNDPQGWTYGHEWLMENLPRIVRGLAHSSYGDVTPYITWCPGYDAVFYGWGKDGEVPDGQPQRVIDYGNLLRSLLPDCVSGIEFTPGNIPVGEGGEDFNGRMQVFDVLLAEYRADYPRHDDDEWQINARMVRPYHRPGDQPANDDPNPPWYLAPGNPRGPYFFVSYERETYLWVRGRVSREDIAASARYHRDMGVRNVCFHE